MTSRLMMARPGTAWAAFTLVELLLVLTLAVFLSAMAMPALTGTLARVRLNSAAERVRTVWAEARLEAMRSGAPIAFQCQLGTGQYSVHKLDDLSEAVAFADPQASQTLSDDTHEDLGAITFVQLTVGDSHSEEVDPSVASVVVFHPDGLTDDALAIVQDDSGEQRRIELRGLTGAAVMVQDAIEEAR